MKIVIQDVQSREEKKKEKTHFHDDFPLFPFTLMYYVGCALVSMIGKAFRAFKNEVIIMEIQ